MRKIKTEVIEDVVISENCPSAKKFYTGGESKLEFPFTISFMCEGDYKVSIRNGCVYVRPE